MFKSWRIHLGYYQKDRHSRQAHTTALVGILQLAKAHLQGFVGLIAHFVSGAWFTANVDILFQMTPPLEPSTQFDHRC
jgi:hypothetical protein